MIVAWILTAIAVGFFAIATQLGERSQSQFVFALLAGAFAVFAFRTFLEEKARRYRER
jgi:putative effector of murein hydrolase